MRLFTTFLLLMIGASNLSLNSLDAHAFSEDVARGLEIVSKSTSFNESRGEDCDDEKGNCNCPCGIPEGGCKDCGVGNCAVTLTPVSFLLFSPKRDFIDLASIIKTNSLVVSPVTPPPEA